MASKKLFVVFMITLLIFSVFVSAIKPGNTIFKKGGYKITGNQVLSTNLQSGLLALWHLDNDLVDSSPLKNYGLKYDLTSNNHGGGSAGFDAGKVGSAGKFTAKAEEGVNHETDYNMGGRFETTSAFPLGESFSVSLWFNKNFDPTSERVLLAQHSFWNEPSGWSLTFPTSDSLAFKVGGVVTFKYLYTRPLKNDVWYHVVAVYNKYTNQMLLYWKGVNDLDGFKVVEASQSYTPSGLPLAIGSYPSGASYEGQYGFHGKIDEVAVWNRPLSSAEVAELYAKDGLVTTGTVGSSTTTPVTTPTPVPTPVPASAPVSGSTPPVSQSSGGVTSTSASVCEATKVLSSIDFSDWIYGTNYGGSNPKKSLDLASKLSEEVPNCDSPKFRLYGVSSRTGNANLACCDQTSCIEKNNYPSELVTYYDLVKICPADKPIFMSEPSSQFTSKAYCCNLKIPGALGAVVSTPAPQSAPGYMRIMPGSSGVPASSSSSAAPIEKESFGTFNIGTPEPAVGDSFNVVVDENPSLGTIVTKSIQFPTMFSVKFQFWPIKAKSFTFKLSNAAGTVLETKTVTVEEVCSAGKRIRQPCTFSNKFITPVDAPGIIDCGGLCIRLLDLQSPVSGSTSQPSVNHPPVIGIIKGGPSWGSKDSMGNTIVVGTFYVTTSDPDKDVVDVVVENPPAGTVVKRNTKFPTVFDVDFQIWPQNAKSFSLKATDGKGGVTTKIVAVEDVCSAGATIGQSCVFTDVFSGNSGVKLPGVYDCDGLCHAVSSVPIVATPTCTPNWQCGSWGECINPGNMGTSGAQMRTCTDSKKCGATTKQETQGCTCTAGYKCYSSREAGYQSENCGWEGSKLCSNGCVNGVCTPSAINPTTTVPTVTPTVAPAPAPAVVPTTASTNLQDGLLALWHLDNDLVDSSPGKRFGLSYLHRGVGSAVLSAGRSGYGSAGRFVAPSWNDGGRFETSSALPLWKSFSVSLWFNRDIVPTTERVLLADHRRWDAASGWALTFPSSANLAFKVGGGGTSKYLYARLLDNNVWYHAVAVYDNDKRMMRLYLSDEKPITKLEQVEQYTASQAEYTASQTDIIPRPSPLPLAIGSYPTDPTDPTGVRSNAGRYGFNGKIDEVAVWNRALSADDVTYLYANGLPALTTRSKTTPGGSVNAPAVAVTQPTVAAPSCVTNAFSSNSVSCPTDMPYFEGFPQATTYCRTTFYSTPVQTWMYSINHNHLHPEYGYGDIVTIGCSASGAVASGSIKCCDKPNPGHTV